jgi:G3E family GTPase
MELHLVGGFLGSGKTTAIVTLSKRLISQGVKVGVVTNDQGKYLVDTAFIKSNDIPSVEVTNGCFCCNYENLEEKLEQLKDSAKPDVIFAESVGSCGDLVATVIKPLLELEGSKTKPTSLSVFVDSQLLQLYLTGEELPFSENVLYIFKKQIEEGQILVLNKIDLLNQPEIDQLITLANLAFPSKTIRVQNSQNPDDVWDWYQLVSKSNHISDLKPIQMDYEKYGLGEAELAWFDQEIQISNKNGNVVPAIITLIQTIQMKLYAEQSTIGHLKFIIRTPEIDKKVSITTIEQSGWEGELMHLYSENATVLINARAQISPTRLEILIHQATDHISQLPNIVVKVSPPDSFQPGFPHPTHRME